MDTPSSEPARGDGGPDRGRARHEPGEDRPDPGDRDPSPLPLEGVLVVSLEQAVAAPFATRKLAEAGARVIKVERPGGDFARRYDEAVRGRSAYFVWLNRGKESVVLDIKDPDDAGLLRRIVARADVFVQNLAPGAAARAGFGSAALRERHRRLVTCDISGYGEEGPYATKKAYDNLVQGEAGIHAVTGHPDAPAKVGVSICDIGAGMHAYASVVEALLLRERTGEGSGLRVSLFSAMADWMSVPYLQAVYGGSPPRRMGLSHASIAPYGGFVCGDGGRVLLAIQNEREWKRFCASVLNRPDLAHDPRFRTGPDRVRNRPALREAIEEVFGERSRDEVARRLERAGIAHGRLRSVEAFASHPQLRRMSVETPEGEVELPEPPVRWADRAPGRPAVPEAGEHGEAIRREFGGEGTEP